MLDNILPYLNFKWHAVACLALPVGSKLDDINKPSSRRKYEERCPFCCGIFDVLHASISHHRNRLSAGASQQNRLKNIRAILQKASGCVSVADVAEKFSLLKEYYAEVGRHIIAQIFNYLKTVVVVPSTTCRFTSFPILLSDGALPHLLSFIVVPGCNRFNITFFPTQEYHLFHLDRLVPSLGSPVVKKASDCSCLKASSHIYQPTWVNEIVVDE